MNWGELQSELAKWRDLGRVPDLWWRDDDAGKPNHALERLLQLARSSGVPLALAVVPAEADAKLMAGLDAGVSVIQHGTDHLNRAAPGEKKTEFPAAENGAQALARLAAGKKVLEGKAARRFFPVLAPPWNRLPERLVPLLAPAYVGLSRYGTRNTSGSLRQVNTHVDIVAWQGDRGFVGDEAALQMVVRHLASRRDGTSDAGEATGILTHHACHDPAAWEFLERLFAITRTAGAQWRSAAELFR